MKYILDIETKPNEKFKDLFFEGLSAGLNLKDPEKIEADLERKRSEAHKKMATDSDYCDIVCIGVKPIGKKPMIFTLQEYSDWLNRRQKVKGGGYIEYSNFTMVTFNGRGFDVPVILKAAIREGITRFPFKQFRLNLEKYLREPRHIDLMEKLSMQYGQFKSLDQYLRLYCGIEKETSGEAFFRSATDEQLKEHCLQDLEYTEALYLKLEPLLV